MKKILLILILAAGCLNNAKTSADSGVDQIYDDMVDVKEMEDVRERDVENDRMIAPDESDTSIVPTVEDCERYDTEKACFNAGCPIFAEVSIISFKNGVCGNAIPGTVCWTTSTGDALSQGLETYYSREESDGSKTVVFSSTGYSEVLGWEPCTGQCLCASEF